MIPYLGKECDISETLYAAGFVVKKIAKVRDENLFLEKICYFQKKMLKIEMIRFENRASDSRFGSFQKTIWTIKLRDPQSSKNRNQSCLKIAILISHFFSDSQILLFKLQISENTDCNTIYISGTYEKNVIYLRFWTFLTSLDTIRPFYYAMMARTNRTPTTI